MSKKPITRSTVKKALKLKSEPSAELIIAYERLAAFNTPEGVIDIKGMGKKAMRWTPEDIDNTLREELVTNSVGELLAKARLQSGLSHSKAAKKAELSRGRISQLEHKDANLEIATIVHQAHALGYRVKLSLEPYEQDKSSVTVTLP